MIISHYTNRFVVIDDFLDSDLLRLTWENIGRETFKQSPVLDTWLKVWGTDGGGAWSTESEMIPQEGLPSPKGSRQVLGLHFLHTAHQFASIPELRHLVLT